MNTPIFSTLNLIIHSSTIYKVKGESLKHSSFFNLKYESTIHVILYTGHFYLLQNEYGYK